jgi:hypothetical protein
MTEDCTFEGVGSNKAEILKSVQQSRDDGWESHNPIHTATAGEFLVNLYENRYADGTRFIGSGILRFNSEGRVTEIVGRGGVPEQPSG